MTLINRTEVTSMARMFYGRCVLTIVLLLSATGARADFRADVEADWHTQLLNREAGPESPPTPETDAMGGCDGVKDGKWGFHTQSDRNPWWQVDLGAAVPVDHVTLWNRCDAAARNDGIVVQFSQDGREWKDVFTHSGSTFYGFTDGKPLVAPTAGETARYVRVTLRDTEYLHLDEVEVFGAADSAKNIALNMPALQSSISPWSRDHRPDAPRDWQWADRVQKLVKQSRALILERARQGVDVSAQTAALDAYEQKVGGLDPAQLDETALNDGRWIRRELLLKDPLLNFDSLFFAKRVPGSYNHMSDQYYGWWSRPGGGLFLMSGFKSGTPELRCISDRFTEPGSFMRPSLSFDGKKVVFAWCKYHAGLSEQPDKLTKGNVPEDAFYHVYEMNLDGTALRRLTRGKYDDFDARYLPDGRILFLSTRRGQSLQAGAESAAETMKQPDLPDCYVRCGGGPERPVAVYTLHTMNADGSGINAISPFEMFEWTPSVAADGSILYSRWDYIDRWNMPYMSLWSIHPDGTNSRLVYKNYTLAPHCTFEPQSIPNSNKIVFTGSAHHAQTMGSLVLFDPTVGLEGANPVKRITPEVIFPEIEGWPKTYYASPWPLSERLYLTAWGVVPAPNQGKMREANDMGIYLYDAESGQLELLYRDREFACEWPMPATARPTPPTLADSVRADAPKEGRYLIADVYRGLKTVQRGDVKALRVIAVPAKTQPTMNTPRMGLTNDDPGKCVLGTVPVDPDGSAYFRVPSGVTMFFQALDSRGAAIQTMRGAVHVQPGQTLGCIGCHENRLLAPPAKSLAQAARRDPSKITPGPNGTWPLRFDRLVQPLLDVKCVRCHNPESEYKRGAEVDLMPEHAWETLCNYGKPSLAENVRGAYALGYSVEGTGAAVTSPLLALLTAPEKHYNVELTPEEVERFTVWLDTYGQRLGAFSDDQERHLEELKAQSAEMLAAR
jgi:hypothetical protein